MDKDKQYIIRSFTPSSTNQDSLLAKIGFTLIAGFIGLLSISQEIDILIKVFLLVSIISLSISCFLLLWYTPRLKLRIQRWTKTSEEIFDDNFNEMREHIRIYDKPLRSKNFMSKLKTLEKVKMTISKDDYRSIINKITRNDKDMSEKQHYLVNMFMNKFLLEISLLRIAIFMKPLDENNAKVKHFLDTVSNKTRYHFFSIGVTTFLLAMIALLLKK